MTPEEYRCRDAAALAELIRRGAVSAAEVLERAIAECERLNPRLNAVVTPMYEQARAQLTQADPRSPLYGVPFLLKDLLHPYAGVPLSSGSRALVDEVPAHDSALVRRMKQAGLAIFGKTNTPELGLMAVTEPALFGPARNPWDLGRSPGGSSGGSAAAVAAGIVPAAHGNDGGGSLRIPASCCGLFALKPSRGRISLGPDRNEVWGGATADLAITRSVRDSALLLDCLHGPEPGDPYGVAPPRRPYAEQIAQPPQTLRIGFHARSPLGPVDHECGLAVERTAALLEELGHRVEEVEHPVDAEAMARDYALMYQAEAAGEVHQIERARGSAALRRLEVNTRTLAAGGRGINAARYSASRSRWNDYVRTMGRFHQRYDCYLTPTLAILPPAIGSFGSTAGERFGASVALALGLGPWLGRLSVLESLILRNLSKVPFTQLANLTGQPAMSVPLHWSQSGLPVGVQFVAAHGEEGLLLKLAAQLEQARPWAARRPPALEQAGVA